MASHLYDTPWPYFQHFTPGCEEKHCLFVCLFFKTLFIYLHGFPHMHRNKRTRPFAASHLCRTKPSCWKAKVALRQDKQSKLLFEINYVFLLFVQPRPQGAVPWHWRWVPTSKAREKRPGDEVAVWLVPVRRLLSSVVVLYHVNGWLLRAYLPIADRRVPNNEPRSNCGTNFGSSSLLAFMK